MCSHSFIILGNWWGKDRWIHELGGSPGYAASTQRSTAEKTLRVYSSSQHAGTHAFTHSRTRTTHTHIQETQKEDRQGEERLEARKKNREEREERKIQCVSLFKPHLNTKYNSVLLKIKLRICVIIHFPPYPCMPRWRCLSVT